MALVRWDAFRELNTFESQVNRIFGGPGRNGSGRGSASTTTWAPNVDIFETDPDLVLKAELPGVDPKNVDLSLEKNVLTLKGERHFENEDEKDNYHRIERSYGSFTRSFTLPAIIEEAKIRADYKDGVLTVSLPKKETVKPRQIKIAS